MGAIRHGELPGTKAPAPYADDLLTILRRSRPAVQSPDEDDGGADNGDFRQLDGAGPEQCELDAAKDQFNRGELQLDKYLQHLINTHSAPRAPSGSVPAVQWQPVSEPAACSVPATPALPVPAKAPVRELPRQEMRDGSLWGLALLLVFSALAAWLLSRSYDSILSPAGAPAPGVPAAAPTTRSPATNADIPVIAPVQAPRARARPVPQPTTPHAATAALAPTVGFATGARIVVPESTRFITIKVRATGGLREPIGLSVRTVEGAAHVNEDFVPPVPHLSLTRDRRSAEVLVSLLSDTVHENVEDFSVVLGLEQGRALLGNPSVVVVLTDDD